MAADALATGVFTTVLGDDELITGVGVPKLSAKARWGYYKFCIKPGEFPEASAAAVFDPVRGAARVFIGALDGPPVSLNGIAAAVAAAGSPSNDKDIDAAVAAAAPSLDAIDRRLHAAVLKRALQQAVAP